MGCDGSRRADCSRRAVLRRRRRGPAPIVVRRRHDEIIRCRLAFPSLLPFCHTFPSPSLTVLLSYKSSCAVGLRECCRRVRTELGGSAIKWYLDLVHRTRNFFLQNRRGLINIYEYFPPGSRCGMQWKAWPNQTQENGSRMSVSKRHVLVLWCQGHSQFVC